MMINNKFNGYSRDGVRLYFDPATIASLATMAEGAGAASSAAAAAAAAEAAAAAAAATAATTAAAPTMLETISGAMKAGTYPGATAAPVAETVASAVPQITGAASAVPTGPIPGSEGIMQAMQAGPPPGAQPLPPAGSPTPMTPEVLGPLDGGLPQGAFPGNSTNLPIEGPSQLTNPASAYNQNIFSDPTVINGKPYVGNTSTQISSADMGSLQNMNEMERRALQGGTGINYAVPQGGTLDASAGGLDSLGLGIEKAVKFMMKNATPLSLGAQAVSALSGQGQQGQKRSTFKPGYGLSPNFKPTLAPSAPSGVYGSEYNRRMAEGGIASGAEQPSYEPNVSRFAQGGIAHYAAGGKTFGEKMAERMAAQADAPVAKATATKATTAAPAAKATTSATASKSMPDAMATVEKALGLAPGTATIQQVMAADKAYKAGQPITAETLKANMPATTTSSGIVGPATPTGFVSTNPVSTNVPAFTVSPTPVTNTTAIAPGTGGTGVKPMTVSDLYTKYFNRPADEGGLASWTAQFGNEVDAAELQTFLNAQSTKDEMAGLSGTTKPVTNTTTTTDTTTTPAKTDPNVNPLSPSEIYKGGAGRYTSNNYGQIYDTSTGLYVTQAEVDKERAKAPAFDINSLYRKYLDRNADESGIKTYDPSKYTAQQVSDFLMQSDEYKKQTLDPDEIQNAYRRVLQRDVDPTGAKGYLGQNYSAGAFEDFLKKSQEYKEEVPFRTMERTIYKPEYEDYTKNPITSVPGMAIPDKLSYAAIQNQLGGTPTYNDVVRSSAVFEANKPTTPDQYMAMSKKGETGANMAAGGSAEDKDSALQAKYAKLQGIKTEEQTQADLDDLVAYQKRMNEMGINTDDDLDTRLLDPYSAAQVRLAKVGKKYKVPVAEMPKTGTNLATMAQGGITQNLGGYSDGGHLLKGPGDGMSDHIPAMIGKRQPARLADGEFVIPADVVSHLGNGSTEAGAKQLYAMMSRIRKARTGNPKQGKQVNPRKLMPK